MLFYEINIQLLLIQIFFSEPVRFFFGQFTPPYRAELIFLDTGLLKSYVNRTGDREIREGYNLEKIYRNGRAKKLVVALVSGARATW